MRNLILNQIHNENLSLISNSLKDKNTKIIISVFDEINNYLILICTDMKIYIFSYKSHSKSKLEKEIELEETLSNNSDLLMNIMSEIDNKQNPFIYLIYKSEIESIIICLKTGELITININSYNSQIKKIIEEPNIKIISMENSPNQEIIVLVLSNFKLIILSYDSLTKINESNLDDGDLSDISKDNNICEEAKISFKSNGDLFGVIYKINNGYKCLVRDNKLNIIKGPSRADNKIVFSVAESPLNYLCNLIAFMPSGSLIAFYDKLNKKIIFSEKNCLVHGEFKILLNNNCKDKDINPIVLNWNFDSPMILYIFEVDNKYYIQIYHRSNYEWTLKYEICKTEKIINSKFSDFVSNQIFILYDNKNFEILNFEWEYTSSLYYGNNFTNNNGEICVVNNNTFIRYTPLGLINIPPPLSLINIDSNIGKKNFWFKNFFFSLNNKVINVYKSEIRKFDLFISLTFDYDLNIETIKKCIFVPLYKKNIGVIIINTIIEGEIENENLIFIGYSINYNENKSIEKFKEEKSIFIQECKLQGYNTGIIFNSVKFDESYEKEYFDENNILSKNTTLNEEKKEEEKKPKIGLDLLEDFQLKKENSNLEEDKIFFYYTAIETNTNEYIFTYLNFDVNTLELSKFNYDTILNITHNNKNERILYISSALSYKKKEIIFYLTHNNHFYQNGNLLANDINSYIIFKHFILFTQMSSSPYSTLHFIDLNIDNLKDKLNANLYNQNLNYKDFNMRTLERGSSIVTCSNIKVILQMPRGNLETISPRLIILDQIKKLVLNKVYDEAFSLCRKNKINLNFIYDLNPIFFMQNLSIFIEKVNKPEYINLFINSLNNEKCEEYQILFNDKKKGNDNEKVNKICTEIRKILQEKKNDDYITSILITLIKQNPPLYLDSLKLVQKLKIEGDKKADKALEFLCWIVNANTLFDFALKTYDFELVIMCAKHTQKDPKEYLSYLNKLEEIKKEDPILMKYQINLDQKFYSDALIELSKGGDKYFNKCLELIKNNKLFDLGLSLFNQPINEILYSQIYEAKGDYYESEKNYLKASICFVRSRNYNKAIKCYLTLGKVNEVISLLITNNNDIKLESDLYNIILNLTNDCKLKKLNQELDKIYLYLINNKQWEKFTPEEFSNISIKLIEGMISNKMYTNAYFSTINLMRIIKDNEKYSSNSSELLKKLYDDLNLTYDLLYNNLQKNYNFFKEKSTRLEIVQQLKKEHPELFIIDINKNENEEDNVSDSGSIRSGKSKKSSSSKFSKFSKKTKNKKNKRNVKEGSPLEEEYLIEILKDFKYEDKEFKSVEEFCDVLNLCKFNSKSNSLREINNLYEKEVNGKIKKMFLINQINFANEHPEINDLFPELNLSQIINNNNNDINIINIKKK